MYKLYKKKEMKYLKLCMLALLASVSQSKLVVYGPDELIAQFNSNRGTDVKSKSHVQAAN